MEATTGDANEWGSGGEGSPRCVPDRPSDPKVRGSRCCIVLLNDVVVTQWQPSSSSSSAAASDDDDDDDDGAEMVSFMKPILKLITLCAVTVD